MNHLDEYAFYVLSEGRKHPIGNSVIQQRASGVSASVRSSRPHLIDPLTSVAIELTVISALYHSQTFQSIVAFSLSHHHINLEDIRYQNVYELNREHTTVTDIQEITFDDIQNIDSLPIIIHTEAGDPDNIPHVNISPVPNQDTADYPFWQEALIHEIIHHLTGSDDPRSETDSRLGPTEILARHVADDMDWPIPPFSGYDTPDRNAAIQQRDFRALHNTLNRLPARRTQVMDRLTAIADGEDASEDFSEREVRDEGSVYNLPLPDSITFDSPFPAGSFLFPGASAASTKPVTRIWNIESRVCAKNKHVIFNDKQYLTQRDLEVLSLSIAERAFTRAINGGGFRKKNYQSWKEWYQKSAWKPTFPFGIYDYGLDEAEGNDIFNPYGILFNDGSFSIGITEKDIKYGPKDNWTTLAGGSWGHTSAGQIFFDKNGRPVAIVITDSVTGFFGSGWSYIYINGRWEYESKDDWDERRFANREESLDPNAARFLINKREV